MTVILVVKLAAGEKSRHEIPDKEESLVTEEERKRLAGAGIDALEGIRCSGSEKLWRSLLGDFYKLVDVKSAKLEKCLADDLLRDYTIEVHALKNTARMIGAKALSEWFYRMEECGNAKDVQTLRDETPRLLKEYRELKEVLRPYGEIENKEKREASVRELKELLIQMRDSMDQFDIDGVDAAMSKLEECRIPEECEPYLEKLRVYIADVMMEEIIQTADEMMRRLDEVDKGL